MTLGRGGWKHGWHHRAYRQSHPGQIRTQHQQRGPRVDESYSQGCRCRWWWWCWAAVVETLKGCLHLPESAKTAIAQRHFLITPRMLARGSCIRTRSCSCSCSIWGLHGLHFYFPARQAARECTWEAVYLPGKQVLLTSSPDQADIVLRRSWNIQAGWHWSHGGCTQARLLDATCRCWVARFLF